MAWSGIFARALKRAYISSLKAEGRRSISRISHKRHRQRRQTASKYARAYINRRRRRAIRSSISQKYRRRAKIAKNIIISYIIYITTALLWKWRGEIISYHISSFSFISRNNKIHIISSAYIFRDDILYLSRHQTRSINLSLREAVTLPLFILFL